jgi:cell wall-associated NlpC family hydrolase
VSSQITGRHRAPSPLSSASNLSLALSRTAKPASKASAVIVISGAMVASLALPATAATPVAKAPAAAPFALAVAVAVAAPSAAQAPLVPRAFGNIGFKGVVKPKPKPKPVVAPVIVPRAAVAVSRSTTRAPISSTSASPTASTQQASVAAPDPRTGGALGIAASLSGIYYVYGGTTTAGFDCSGFTQYVFNKLGISIPRTAAEQQQAVTPVSDPRPGDLVFFGSPAYHVGIYAGNGMMWDAPHTGAAVALRAVWSSNPSYGRP